MVFDLNVSDVSAKSARPLLSFPNAYMVYCQSNSKLANKDEPYCENIQEILDFAILGMYTRHNAF